MYNTFEDMITYDNKSLFFDSNADALEGCKDIKGIIIHFHSIGDVSEEGTESMKTLCTEKNVVYIYPLSGPWNWMNPTTVRLADRCIDIIIEHFGLASDTPVISSGGSMGGQCCLTYPVYAKHNIVAVMADSPVCDLEKEAEAWDFVCKTYVHGLGGCEGTFTEALRAHSPVWLVDKMPRVPYWIICGTNDATVPDKINGVALAEKMKNAGFDLTFYNIEGMTHCGMPAEKWQEWLDNIPKFLSV